MGEILMPEPGMKKSRLRMHQSINIVYMTKHLMSKYYLHNLLSGMINPGSKYMKTKYATRKKIEAEDFTHSVLVAFRRIIHAVDLQSKQVSKASGLTTPQILILRAIHDLGEVTSSRISEQVSLSQATVTTIMDRMEKRGLIERYRSVRDRRIVHTRLTVEGQSALRKSPPLLNEKFINIFSRLDKSHQRQIVDTLEEVAGMLGVDSFDALPFLDVEPPVETEN